MANRLGQIAFLLMLAVVTIGSPIVFIAYLVKGAHPVSATIGMSVGCAIFALMFVFQDRLPRKEAWDRTFPTAAAVAVVGGIVLKRVGGSVGAALPFAVAGFMSVFGVWAALHLRDRKRQTGPILR